MNLALFDFDGTITVDYSDSFSDFVRFAVRPGRMVVGALLVGPLVLAYRFGAVKATRARCAVARVGFRGEDARHLRQLGLIYATTRIFGTLRRRAVERIEWHKSQGDQVVVVSAALDVYLCPWCESVGVDCICTRLEERDGTITGRYVDGDCTGAEKARRVVERYRLDDYSHVYAYGDTSEDREMLAIADRKVYRWREIADPPGEPVHREA